MNLRSNVFAALAALAALSFLANCSESSPAPAGGGGAGGAGGSSADVPVPYSGGEGGQFLAVKAIIQTSCFGAGCHDEPGNPMQLKPFDTLHWTLTHHQTRVCGAVVTPANPQTSALVRLLKGPCNDGVGGMANEIPRMPFTKCLSDTDDGCIKADGIAAIEAWISAGAPH